MSLNDMLSYPSDLPYPMPKKYNPADYSSIKGSGFYQALQNGMAQQGNTDADVESHLYGFGSRNPIDANYLNDYAKAQALGSLQPADEAQRMQQWQLGNEWNQRLFNVDQNAIDAQQQLFGGLLGTGLGAALGYANNRRFRNGLNNYGDNSAYSGFMSTQNGINGLDNIGLSY